ncbi:hypothetical protein BOTBODRAFT_375554 [Botryobasidium botryosum FD-172 SS1]|uniref:Uncharacterized protein n=1 Tax=Botryobasidium botryosum (strain FD-172 SS1) TaxID=930990 RepID=A0A067N6I1_BOTB1|nr:hypothetical protein BOTBODRAFT_375554 [Botryobasidium botryosum FD-172 SS1]
MACLLRRRIRTCTSPPTRTLPRSPICMLQGLLYLYSMIWKLHTITNGSVFKNLFSPTQLVPSWGKKLAAGRYQDNKYNKASSNRKQEKPTECKVIQREIEKEGNRSGAEGEGYQ